MDRDVRELVERFESQCDQIRFGTIQVSESMRVRPRKNLDNAFIVAEEVHSCVCLLLVELYERFFKVKRAKKFSHRRLRGSREERSRQGQIRRNQCSIGAVGRGTVGAREFFTKDSMIILMAEGGNGRPMIESIGESVHLSDEEERRPADKQRSEKRLK